MNSRAFEVFFRLKPIHTSPFLATIVVLNPNNNHPRTLYLFYNTNKLYVKPYDRLYQ